MISNTLPNSWAEYTKWRRWRDGVVLAFLDGFEAWKRLHPITKAFEHLAIAVDHKQKVGNGEPDYSARAPKALVQTLGNFFDGEADLDFATLSALSSVLFGPTGRPVSGPFPIDIHRAEWSTLATPDTGHKLDSDTVGWRRLIPSHSMRSMDAYIGLTSIERDALPPHVHPGDQVIYVVSGHLRGQFYGGWDIDLGPGDAIWLDGLHPHNFWRPPGAANPVFVSVMADYFGASAPLVVGSFFVKEERVKKLVGLERAIALRVAAAISAMPAELAKISDISSIGSERLGHLRKAQVPIKNLEELRELAYVLRLPESYFYLPMDKGSGAAPYVIVSAAEISDLRARASARGLPVALPFHAIERQGDLATAWIRGFNPSIARPSRIQVGVLTACDGTTDDIGIASQQAEELVVVLGGTLNAAFDPLSTSVSKPQQAVSGVLRLHDALWSAPPLATRYSLKSKAAHAIRIRNPVCSGELKI